MKKNISFFDNMGKKPDRFTKKYWIETFFCFINVGQNGYIWENIYEWQISENSYFKSSLTL